MMKGHAKIELFDAKTGELKEVREEKNLVTNATKYMMAFLNKINRAPGSEVFPIATKALGGIMLFNKEIEEDPENIEFPIANQLIGYAGRETNVTNPQAGSLNPLETVNEDDGYTTVWDFGTSQANGVIKSICLTSAYAGRNPYVYMYDGDFASSLSYRNDPLNPYAYVPLLYKDGYLYLYRGKIIYKTRFNPYKIMSVHDGTGVGNLTLEQVVDLTDDLPAPGGADLMAWGYHFDGGDGYIHFMYFHHDNYGVSPNWYSPASLGNESTVRIGHLTLRYDDDSWEVSETEVVTLQNAQVCDLADGCRNASKGWLYWRNRNNNGIYIIQLSNLTNINLVAIGNEGESNIRVGNSIRRFLDGDGVAFSYVYRVPNDSNDYTRLGFIYHDGLMHTNAISSGRSYDNIGQFPLCKLLGLTTNAPSYPWDDERTYMLAAYLGTINNLSTPIVKNPSMTMKISYTLTDLEE